MLLRETWNGLVPRQSFNNNPGAPFLEGPGNFLGPKSNIQIEIKRVRARVLATKLLHFVSLTDSFIMFMQTIETSVFNVNGSSLPSPLIIGTFEKRAPELSSMTTLWKRV